MYVVVIDAGILSTKVHLFRWDGTTENPASLRMVKPDGDELYYASKPGFHTLEDDSDDKTKIAIHLAPIISRLKIFLGAHEAPPNSMPHIHVFLVASGLRHCKDSERANEILTHAYEVIQATCSSFSVGTQQTNVIIPEEHDMNAFAWTGLMFNDSLPKLTMTDIVSSPMPKPYIIMPYANDELIMRLSFDDWKDDLPPLSSSPWLTGAAALIIQNGMVFDGDLTAGDRLPPIEFILRGTVQMTTALVSDSISTQASLLQQISQHRNEMARVECVAKAKAKGDDDELVASSAHMNALNQAAKDVWQELTQRGIKHAITGGYAMALLGSPRKPRELNFLLDSTSAHLKVADLEMIIIKGDLPIIAPQYLLMSKFKLWDNYDDIKPPQSVAISREDEKDIEYLLRYLDKVKLRGTISYHSFKSHVSPNTPAHPLRLLQCTAAYFLSKAPEERDDLLPPNLLAPEECDAFWRFMAQGKPQGAETFEAWNKEYQKKDKRSKRRGQ
ncbi:hypothetical protein H0H92_005065 [Tricholoma furcatifolium]|nr:hypothetical protein H0H92_005065 [Tricholoma furcatifolium]